RYIWVALDCFPECDVLGLGCFRNTSGTLCITLLDWVFALIEQDAAPLGLFTRPVDVDRVEPTKPHLVFAAIDDVAEYPRSGDVLAILPALCDAEPEIAAVAIELGVAALPGLRMGDLQRLQFVDCHVPPFLHSIHAYMGWMHSSWR